jgi:hypothetical protein
MLAALSLFNVPEELQARYELFHTAYVDGRRITIVDQPLIPGQNLTSLLQIAKSIKEAYEKGFLTYTANETGFYATARWRWLLRRRRETAGMLNSASGQAAG